MPKASISARYCNDFTSIGEDWAKD